MIRSLPRKIDQRTAAARVGRNKTAQQFVERSEHLTRETR